MLVNRTFPVAPSLRSFLFVIRFHRNRPSFERTYFSTPPRLYVFVYANSIRIRIDLLRKESYTFGMDETLSSLLRDLITECGMGHNELSRKSGVPQPTISRFAAGADLRLSTADKLLKHLGISIGWSYKKKLYSTDSKKPRGK
jgi:hypothetical protein